MKNELLANRKHMQLVIDLAGKIEKNERAKFKHRSKDEIEATKLRRKEKKQKYSERITSHYVFHTANNLTMDFIMNSF